MNILTNKDDWKLEKRKNATDTAQSACNGLLCVGDEVTWTHVQRRGLISATLTTRRAKIIHLTGHNVAVKFRGKLINLRPDAVRKIGMMLDSKKDDDCKESNCPIWKRLKSK
jgi:hypothetical protein